MIKKLELCKTIIKEESKLQSDEMDTDQKHETERGWDICIDTENLESIDFAIALNVMEFESKAFFQSPDLNLVLSQLRSLRLQDEELADIFVHLTRLLFSLGPHHNICN